jgi:hypothetical protein
MGTVALSTPASATIQPGYHQVMDQSWSKCLDVLGGRVNNGADVGVWHCVDAGNQRWTMEPIGTGFSRLRVQHSSSCLSLEGTENGANVVQDACQDRPDQQWLAVDAGAGWSYLTSLATPGKCLDKANWDVTVWTCQNVPWQKWESLG